MWWRRGWGLALVSVLLLVACTPRPDPAPSSAWQRIEVGGVSPDSLATAGTEVLVGGQTVAVEQTRPRLLSLRDGRVSEVSLRSATPYGEVAEPVQIAAVGDRIHLLGTARGGAHGNPRWSTWSGDAGAVVEHEQVFWVFGGHESGTMVALVAGSAGPVVVGSWAGERGMDVALWTAGQDGTRWERRESAGTDLASTTTRQYEAHGAAGSGGELVVVAGEQLELDHQLRRRPVVWIWESRGAGVRRIELPADEGRADSASCSESACFVAGVTGGRAALWQVWPGSVRAVAVPELAVDAGTPAQVLLDGSGALVVAQSGAVVKVAGRGGDGPAGRPVGAVRAFDGGWLVLVRGPQGAGVWRVS
ncbi:hypothetical protein HJ590_16880 [Naumannella sp. ID2617S]|nr:hypothetical protein [Naumannella sp. ID2617S]